MVRVRIVGAGRAGTSLAHALRERTVWVDGPLARGVDLTAAAQDVDMLILAVSDDAIADLAQQVTPNPACVVMHLSGSQSLLALRGHPRVASLHPLVAMPTTAIGARRLGDGARFAIAGDDAVRDLVSVLGGIAIQIAEDARYHAAACIAANHVVALMGQVERIAMTLGMGLEDFQGLSAAALEDAVALTPRQALTGPAARGDVATLQGHVNALDREERASYLAMAELAQRLVPKSGGEAFLVEVVPRIDGASS